MKNNARLAISTLLFFIVFGSIPANAQQITILQQGTPTSIRGLSVVDDSVAWISGSKGYIATTKNGGKNWAWQQVKGFEKADFRDIEAFSDKEAIIMSSGTPALILKTTDGGASWQVKYKNADTTYFFDAMDFVGKKHGIVLGDPIGGKFVLMETKDKGETWHPFAKPPGALPGEAAFAASGTCLRIDKDGITIVTGGSVARLIQSGFRKPSWNYDYLPMAQGKSSQGAFSISEDIIVVGGDYSKDKSNDGAACWLNPALVSIKTGWVVSSEGPAGFQSCVENISTTAAAIFLSTGTPGSNITTDGGKTWKQIDSVSYNVCRKAKHGKLLLLAGNGGKIAIFRQ